VTMIIIWYIHSLKRFVYVCLTINFDESQSCHSHSQSS